MTDRYAHKSSVEEIRSRFDNDVERFSNLSTGQSATMDAALALDLVAAAAARYCPNARAVLDIGCGAGNYTLKLLEYLPGLDVTLIDLSQPMLERAVERIGKAQVGKIEMLQGDVRGLDLGEQHFDLILAAAVFHHLRGEEEWEAVFAKCHASLKPGGALFIFDMVEHEHPEIQALLWERYGRYLENLKDSAYRDHVFGYINKEDTPRSLIFQLDMLRRCGFSRMDVLHKNACFAAFCGLV
jgi:tRNA (cmo5U34)-methyltransferase